MKNALAIAKKKICREVGLEDAIAELMAFGKPSIFCNADLKWSCTVELNTDQIVEGAKVRSGYGHPTIGSAVNATLQKCYELGH